MLDYFIATNATAQKVNSVHTRYFLLHILQGRRNRSMAGPTFWQNYKKLCFY